MKFIVVCLLIFAFSFPAFAQARPRRQPPGSVQPSKVEPLPPPVSVPIPDSERIVPITTDRDDELVNAWNPVILAEKLPLNFKGHPYKALAQNLWDRRTQLKKDEFETTPQYEARALNVHKQPIVGRLGENDLYAFIEATPTIYTYDADKEVMSIKKDLDRTRKVLLTGDEKIDWNETPSLQLERKVVGVDYYKGSNLYGVVAKVEKVEALKWALLVNNYRGFNVLEQQGSSAILSFTFTVKPLSARLLKPQLRLAYICRLKEPWISLGYDQIKPTINSPREYNEMGFHLPVELIEVRCFNAETGEVYSVVKPRNANEEAAHQESQAIDAILAELKRVLTVLDGGSINTISDYQTLNNNARNLINSNFEVIKDASFKEKIGDVLFQLDFLGNVLSSTNFEPLVNAWVISKGYVKDHLISSYDLKPKGIAKIIYTQEAAKAVAVRLLSKLEIATQVGTTRKNAPGQ